MIRQLIYLTLLSISMLHAAILDTNKEIYESNEQVVASFSELEGQSSEWMAIYPAQSSNDFGHIIQWKLTDANVEGEVTFDGLNVGTYEVRHFNSANFVIAKQFSVEVDPAIVTTVETTKDSYLVEEEIVTVFENMSGNTNDWIGIYPAGSSNDWENMLQWDWIEDGLVSSTHTFDAMPAGDYEVRVFFNDSFNTEASYAFSVNNPIPAVRVVYDDFEDGIDPRWVRHSGREMTLLNVGAIDGAVANKGRQVQVNGQRSLRTYIGGGYYFPFNQPDKRLKFLEVDMKIGVSSHLFNFGVKVKTKFGDRKIEFSSWLNHTLPSGQQIIRGPYGNVLAGHSVAFTTDNYIHSHPAPSDFYVGTSGVGGGSGMFVHYKINLDEKLKVLEPNNEITEILLFSVNGGDYDNLALSPE